MSPLDGIIVVRDTVVWTGRLIIPPNLNLNLNLLKTKMFYKINQLIFEFEIFSKGFPTDGALADFQVDARKVVYVIDTHFVGN